MQTPVLFFFLAYIGYGLVSGCFQPANIPSSKVIKLDPFKECCYGFKNPNFPSFVLPAPQNQSPGDITLNTGNPIVLADGTQLNPGQGMNEI